MLRNSKNNGSFGQIRNNQDMHDYDRKKEAKLYEHNRKVLRDNYTDILKKLEGSNIVKWRILND